MEQVFVSLDKLARESHLTVAYTPKDLDQFKVYTAEVYRPGIMLAGYYQYFDRTRIQIIGLTELSYLNELDPEGRLICQLIMEGKSERDCGKEMGLSRNTFVYRRDKLFKKLRSELKDYI